MSKRLYDVCAETLLMVNKLTGDGEDEDRLIISRGINGFKLTGKYDESTVNEFRVVENTGDDHLEAVENLLFEVLCYFNIGGSKHSKERIRVVREQKNGELVWDDVIYKRNGSTRKDAPELIDANK